MKFILTGSPLWPAFKKHIKNTGLGLTEIDTEKSMESDICRKKLTDHDPLELIWIPAGLLDKTATIMGENECISGFVIIDNLSPKNSQVSADLDAQTNILVNRVKSGNGSFPENIGRMRCMRRVEGLETALMTSILNDVHFIDSMKTIANAVIAKGFTKPGKKKGTITAIGEDGNVYECTVEQMAFECLLNKDTMHKFMIETLSRISPMDFAIGYNQHKKGK